ncbi:MAG: metallophosphoesterase family protein [Lachnospiraceae bacterium]|nr:metallophosphoesterase family protein [Lachnospiraceae bacterium]
MSCQKRLDKSFKDVPILPLCADSRYVLFSDCHRGNGTHNDNFLKNQHLYFAALRHYYREGFTYIELGDGDELWENRDMEQIKELHSNVFWQLSLFYKQKRLYMLYGNHDMVKKYPSYSRKKYADYVCTSSQSREPLFPDIRFYSGIILEDNCTGKRLYLTHGHQASLMNSTLWRVNCFLVRYLWKPLEQIGILDPTSAAKNYTIKQRSEKRLTAWAKQHNRTLITGHTHRPMVENEELHYINTGSCVHPRCITCIEIYRQNIHLVKWYMGTRDNGNFYLEKEELAKTPL